MGNSNFIGELFCRTTYPIARPFGDTLPRDVRDGAALALGGRDDRPDYDCLDGLELRVYAASGDGSRDIRVTGPDGASAVITVVRSDGRAEVSL